MDLQFAQDNIEYLHNDYQLLINGMHHDPHRILGAKVDEAGITKIFIWRPEGESVDLLIHGQRVTAKQSAYPGLFIYNAPKPIHWNDYRIFAPSGDVAYDPYAFLPTMTEEDVYLLSRGIHYKIYDVLGGRMTSHQGVLGAKFAVWAPEAKQVCVCGDFNKWNPKSFPMRQLYQSGVWEIFIPGIQEEASYKFAIKTKDHHIRWKSDPFATYFAKRPQNHSKLFPTDQFQWQDHAWLEQRTKKDFRKFPMNVYEVHLGSWVNDGQEFCNYREIAPKIAAYCVEMGYTHIELLPVCEHPLDESWGYQVTGFYAPTSRYGNPRDFQYFVNYLHLQGIGVILDWVPAHFPIDEHSLARFDGSYLYEHEDPRQGFHPHWNTLIFNYGRYEVANFLIGSALFWIEYMHIDGLRVDAVASMLYLDYGRSANEWIPNKYGGNENLEAIEFLKHLNYVIHHDYPGVLTIAEESTAFLGITHSVDWGGIGFDMKWNMGWMNDTLYYFQQDPIHRKYHHHSLHFMFSYAFSEKYTLVLSHDEVVHGKKSLIAKMPGDYWQRFANLRLLMGFMICHPGKKLLFMGGEIAQWNEWHCKEEMHWFLREYDAHHRYQHFVKQLNHYYLTNHALWELDFEPAGFEWIDFSDADHSIISFFRRGKKKEIVCLFNFTPVTRERYFLQIPKATQLQEAFNSDSQEFGGSGKINESLALQKDGLGNLGFYIDISPLAFQIFEVEFD